MATRTHRVTGTGGTDLSFRCRQSVHLDPLYGHPCLGGSAALHRRVGDAYDNAAAETVMGLFKNEAVAKDSPFRSGALKTETDLMEIVFKWVHWYKGLLKV